MGAVVIIPLVMRYKEGFFDRLEKQGAVEQFKQRHGIEDGAKRVVQHLEFTLLQFASDHARKAGAHS